MTEDEVRERRRERGEGEGEVEVEGEGEGEGGSEREREGMIFYVLLSLLLTYRCSVTLLQCTLRYYPK